MFYFGMQNRFGMFVLQAEAEKPEESRLKKICLDMKKLTYEQMEEISAQTGQKVMDCIIDYYSKHGWASIGLWVVTAFIPEFALLTAFDCIRREA